MAEDADQLPAGQIPGACDCPPVPSAWYGFSVLISAVSHSVGTEGPAGDVTSLRVMSHREAVNDVP